ncbi:hypothetical protein ACTXT7_003252, partial [Hymenolepis weldensis]
MDNRIGSFSNIPETKTSSFLSLFCAGPLGPQHIFAKATENDDSAYVVHVHLCQWLDFHLRMKLKVRFGRGGWLGEKRWNTEIHSDTTPIVLDLVGRQDSSDITTEPQMMEDRILYFEHIENDNKDEIPKEKERLIGNGVVVNVHICLGVICHEFNFHRYERVAGTKLVARDSSNREKEIVLSK